MNYIFGPFVTGRGAAALLIMRLFFGFGLMKHGWGKIQHPFSWLPDPSVPGWLQSLAALSEFGGGLAMIVGLLTPLAMLGILCTMAYAMYVSMGPKGPGYEPAGHYFFVALGLLIGGPGVLSVDAYLFNRPTASTLNAP